MDQTNGKQTPTEEPGSAADGSARTKRQVASRVLNPLELVILTRDRLQETLDDAAERGRLTREDANELFMDLLRIGRQQSEEVLDRLVQAADRARRTVTGSSGVPIDGYDELTARQVTERLAGLKPNELRRVRDYELRHANRKSVLTAVEHELSRS